MNLEEFRDLPLPKKIGIYGGVAILFLVLYIFLILFPKRAEFSEKRENLKKLETLREKELNINRDLQRTMQRIVLLDQELSNTLKKIPEKRNLSEILKALSDAGRQSGVEFLGFNPTNEVTKELYIEIPIEIKIEGKYHDIALFFDKIRRFPRIINISDFNIGEPKGMALKPILTTSFNATAFRLLPAGGKDEKKDKKK